MNSSESENMSSDEENIFEMRANLKRSKGTVRKRRTRGDATRQKKKRVTESESSSAVAVSVGVATRRRATSSHGSLDSLTDEVDVAVVDDEGSVLNVTDFPLATISGEATAGSDDSVNENFDCEEIAPEVEINVEELDPTSDVLPPMVLKATSNGNVGGLSEVQKLMSTIDETQFISCEPLTENLFNLVCMVVYDQVLTGGLTLSEPEKHAIYKHLFVEKLKTLLLDTYLNDNLFSMCNGMFDHISPEDGERRVMWPKFFMEYINDLMSTAPSLTKMNRKPAWKNLTKQELVSEYFGEKIKKTAMETKREITNRVCPLWRHPRDLGSGESPSAMFDAVRATTVDRESYVKAKEPQNSQSN
jgi:hypothetical protein